MSINRIDKSFQEKREALEDICVQTDELGQFMEDSQGQVTARKPSVEDMRSMVGRVAEGKAEAAEREAERAKVAKLKTKAEDGKCTAEATWREFEVEEVRLIRAAWAEARAKKVEAGSSKPSKPEHETEAEAGTDGKTKDAEIADAETKRKTEEEAEARAKADAKAKDSTKAAEAIADAEAKRKAKQDVVIQAAFAFAREKERRRENERLAKLREEEAQKWARQRAADRTARMAHTPSINSARTSGGNWFSKLSEVAEAVASAIVPPSPGDEPKSPSKPTGTGNSDLWTRRSGRGSTSSPGASPVLRPSTAIPSHGPAFSTPSTTIRSSSVESSTPTLVSQEASKFKEKQKGS